MTDKEIFSGHEAQFRVCLETGEVRFQITKDAPIDKMNVLVNSLEDLAAAIKSDFIIPRESKVQ